MELVDERPWTPVWETPQPMTDNWLTEEESNSPDGSEAVAADPVGEITESVVDSVSADAPSANSPSDQPAATDASVATDDTAPAAEITAHSDTQSPPEAEDDVGRNDGSPDQPPGEPAASAADQNNSEEDASTKPAEDGEGTPRKRRRRGRRRRRKKPS